MNMNNFPITTPDGHQYWVSRSVVVTAFLFIINDDIIHVLANKRGKGTPSHQGEWNCPCGFLDYNETLLNACLREVYEETGVKLASSDVCNMRIVDIISDPDNNSQQNIVIQYACVLKDESTFKSELQPHGGEPNEVEDIKWIQINDVGKYKWAFGHELSIINIAREIMSVDYDLSGGIL